MLRVLAMGKLRAKVRVHQTNTEIRADSYALPRKGWVAMLRNFVRGEVEIVHCDLCSAPMAEDHPHLVEVAKRKVLCCCQGCAVILGYQDNDRYRRVPDTASQLPDFYMSDSQWDALQIPIAIAFFFNSTPESRVIALYPSPAGGTESLLPLGAWEDIARANPILREFAPDVEALLVYRVDGAREFYRVPIDRCYELVGLIRTRWRGLSGGAEAWESIREFFLGLRDGHRKHREYARA